MKNPEDYILVTLYENGEFELEADIIAHIDSPSCPCNPTKVFEPDMKEPLYIHNKLKDNPQ